MPQVLHFVLILIGVFFLYTAIFIYEDGNKKIQNRLADIYLAIQIVKEKYSSIRALMIKANELVLTFFAQYFDDGKLTLNFIGISGMLYACFFLYFGFLWEKDMLDQRFLSIFNLQYFFCCAFLIVIVFWAFRKLNRRWPIYFIVVTSGLVCLSVVMILAGNGLLQVFEFILSPFTFSIFCFKLNIVISKWNIKILINKKGRLLVIPTLALIMAAIFGFMCGIIWIFSVLANDEWAASILFTTLIPMLLLIFITNTAFIFLFLAIAANRIIFPVMSEPIRALYEHNLIKNKKTLAAIGFLFLFLAYPSFMDSTLMKAVKDLFK